MKKFILQSISFILIALSAITGMVFLTNKIIRKNAEYVLRPGVDKIVLGHSHSECAFNDSLIKGLQNFSHSGESYFYTWYKIIPLLEKNPAVKTVFIEFANNYFEDPRDKLIWGSRYINYQYPRSAPFFDSKGNRLLLKHNAKAFLNVQSLVAKENMQTIQSGEYERTNITGAYLYLVRDKTDSLLAAGYDKNPAFFNVSETNMEYLRKLIDFCKKTGRLVYLVRSPLHASYPALKFEDQFQELRRERFPDVEFLDFKDFPLLNSEFGDLEHVNYRGARKFSLFFNELLQKGL